ncbi:hypothetical protein Moror_16458 [Moniliophthora roreri MCA 2997]|uniref:Uncharacterized protein n=1 Tax=Moniliophthora roreri (strain MCA 2997) TaxID=1381753 RepID=V2XAV6_MONRO|nr:hypothetical protein Moror_16458 [Moniliophthora roreri MCA 2997]KAI3604314.1 hypothetical protein WG66_008426 [Moniliophthora roreri]
MSSRRQLSESSNSADIGRYSEAPSTSYYFTSLEKTTKARRRGKQRYRRSISRWRKHQVLAINKALDNMRRAILKAEVKGSVTMEHPYMVMDSSIVNRHLNLTNIVRRSPTIIDRMLVPP